MNRRSPRSLLSLGLCLIALTLLPSAVAAESWESYRWASDGPVQITLGDNVTRKWDAPLRSAANDWAASPVVDVSTMAGGTSRRLCEPSWGRVEVCNGRYGDTGWLGLTTVWLDGNRIAQATVRLNETYFRQSAYSGPAWRRYAMCHEVGHALALGHQSEGADGPKRASCMDVTNRPSSNLYPNRRDFRTLKAIYGSASGTDAGHAAGTVVESHQDEDPHTTVTELGNGFRQITIALPVPLNRLVPAVTPLRASGQVHPI